MTATGSTRATLAIVFLCFSVARALSAPLLVVYPEAPEPYREAFAQMVDGIARATRQPLLQKVVAPTTTPEELRGWLGGAGRGEIAVLLGHKALSLYGRDPPPGRAVVVGGISAPPGQTPLPGVSLTLDPALYLQTLRELWPGVRRVVVYCNAEERPWMEHPYSISITVPPMGGIILRPEPLPEPEPVAASAEEAAAESVAAAEDASATPVAAEAAEPPE